MFTYAIQTVHVAAVLMMVNQPVQANVLSKYVLDHYILLQTHSRWCKGHLATNPKAQSGITKQAGHAPVQGQSLTLWTSEKPLWQLRKLKK